MQLATGSRLGIYEIVAPLGAGGMGEVAIKVLPHAVAARADRLARFEHEARSVAALNHPNVVTLCAIEEADGVRFLAMELVEGESLEKVAAPGGMTIPRVLDLAVPLADALVAAHEKGVVHRDLKPANQGFTIGSRSQPLRLLHVDARARRRGGEDPTPDLLALREVRERELDDEAQPALERTVPH